MPEKEAEHVPGPRRKMVQVLNKKPALGGKVAIARGNAADDSQLKLTCRRKLVVPFIIKT